MAEVLYYAIPFFVLLLALECLSFRHLGDDNDLVGFESRDTRTSLTMGLGNVGINAVWKLAVLAAYTVLYELTPLRERLARKAGSLVPRPRVDPSRRH